MYPNAYMGGPRAARSRTFLLFVVFHALYGLTSSGNVFRTPDEFEVYFQTEHLVDAGDLSVPQALRIKQRVVRNGRVIGEEPVFFGTIGRDGKPYAPYGPLAAVLAVPHHLVGRAMAAVAGVPRMPLPRGIAWLMVVGGFTMLATATAAALAVAGFHRAAVDLGAAPRSALIASLLLGTATVLWPYGTSFFSEAFQAAAFIWACVFLIERRVVPAAFLVMVAGLTKVTALIFAPAFAAAILADGSIPARSRASAAAAMIAAIAAAAGIHLAWNAYRFGNPFNFGYDWAETIAQLPARAFLPSDIPRGLFVLLGTPGKSIVIWAPPLILSLAGARAFWSMHRPVAIGIGIAALTGLLFFAAYLFPEGGYAHGPRNLVPIVPLLLLPATAIDLSGRWRGVAFACGILGCTIALLSTSVSYLDDQTIGADLGSGARQRYYERIEPRPGRAFNRYRLGYIPFVDTITAPGWLNAPTLGQGPDYFPFHLKQAQRQLPDGQFIPQWLVRGTPLLWVSVLIGSALALYRR